MAKVGDLVKIMENDKSINMGMFKGKIGIVCEKYGSECMIHLEGMGDISYFKENELLVLHEATADEIYEYVIKDRISLNLN